MSTKSTGLHVEWVLDKRGRRVLAEHVDPVSCVRRGPNGPIICYYVTHQVPDLDAPGGYSRRYRKILKPRDPHPSYDEFEWHSLEDLVEFLDLDSQKYRRRRRPLVCPPKPNTPRRTHNQDVLKGALTYAEHSKGPSHTTVIRGHVPPAK